MNLYISGSNRKHNSYNFLKKIKNEDDILYSLQDLDIQYCLGCSCCAKNEDNHCVLNDDMKLIYEAISKCDNIIIMSPIYMNHITGILKNIFDRFNPYGSSERLRNKKIFLITVGQMSEEKQKEICDSINSWFKSLTEFMYFDFEYLYNFTSGNVLLLDDINKMYKSDDLESIIDTIKEKINAWNKSNR